MYSNIGSVVKNLGDIKIEDDLSCNNGLRKAAPAVPPKPKKYENQDGCKILENVPKGYSAVNSSYSCVQEVSQPFTSPAFKHPCEQNGIGIIQSKGYQNKSYSVYQNQPLKASNSEVPHKLCSNSSCTSESSYSNISPITLVNDKKQHFIYNGNETPPPPPLPPALNRDQNIMYANVSARNPNFSHYANSFPHAKSAAALAYSTYGADDEFPPPPVAVGPVSPPPPSPVSSSYSELRRAAPNYGIYAPPSQESSTYESIYEPVTPRPSSQMSNKSAGYVNYSNSMYGPYASPDARGLAPVPSNQPLLKPDKIGKEAEVDALTNLLVQSMDSSSDPDFFGICAQCGERVLGEGSGCTAMDQVFHIKCFLCINCQIQLQGKPFYNLNMRPHCEECYLNTLEKCCVCTKPILDRILRANGKPYHPQCFTCVVCQKSLDGILFTVDASNQIHCIDDFHKKFAPRCSVCNDPIMPEHGQDKTVRVVALDRSFHVKCYKCEDCGLLLSSEAEGRGCYPLDGHVLCKSCNAHRVQALTSKVSTDL